MQNKHELRQIYTKKRDSLQHGEIQLRSDKIKQILFSTEEYRKSETIMTYINMGSEVLTVPIMEDALAKGKKVGAPRILSRGKMVFIEMRNLNDTKKGRFGTSEPLGDTVLGCDNKTIILVPGLVFAKTGYRIGYGGGYYDRFLRDNDSMRNIGLAFNFQLVEEIPSEEYDVPLDMIISESLRVNPKRRFV